MKIQIKKILLEDYDLSQEYMAHDALKDHVEKVRDFNRGNQAYVELAKRGLSPAEKDALVDGYNRLEYRGYSDGSHVADIQSLLREPIDSKNISDDQIIEKYKNYDIASKYINALRDTHAQGDKFIARESELRDALYDKNDTIRNTTRNLNDKIFNLENQLYKAEENGRNDAQLAGATGLIGGGLLGGYMVNKLKNSRSIR